LEPDEDPPQRRAARAKFGGEGFLRQPHPGRVVEQADPGAQNGMHPLEPLAGVLRDVSSHGIHVAHPVCRLTIYTPAADRTRPAIACRPNGSPSRPQARIIASGGTRNMSEEIRVASPRWIRLI